MAIPTEQGLVKHYSASFAASETAGSVKTIYYTQDGTAGTFDFTVQLQRQGAAIFLDNPLDVDITANIYATMKIYGTDYEVKVGEVHVPATSDQGYVMGFGQLRNNLRLDISNDAAPTAAGDVVVAIVPSNG